MASRHGGAALAVPEQAAPSTDGLTLGSAADKSTATETVTREAVGSDSVEAGTEGRAGRSQRCDQRRHHGLRQRRQDGRGSAGAIWGLRLATATGADDNAATGVVNQLFTTGKVGIGEVVRNATEGVIGGVVSGIAGLDEEHGPATGQMFGSEFSMMTRAGGAFGSGNPVDCSTWN